MKKRMLEYRVSFLFIVILVTGMQAQAFVRDTHYYLGFAAALSTCFDWDEAHIIASANLMVDGNKNTRAEMTPLRTHAKIEWHAFGHRAERYNELWYRVLDEQDPNKQLILFGQFLHFLQDWESHAGFGRSLGHATATVLGRDPDSMALDHRRTMSSLQATLDHMAQVCEIKGRLPEGVNDSDEAVMRYLEHTIDDQVIDDMVAASDSRWRRGKGGSMTKLGQAILENNINRVEVFIEQWIKPNPEKHVPDNFSAGDPENGMPPAIDMTYDRAGVLQEDPVDIVAAAGEDVDEADDDGDDELSVDEVKEVEGDSWWMMVVRTRESWRTVTREPGPEGGML